VEETGILRVNHQPATDIMFYQVSPPVWDSNSTLVVIGTDCIDSCKSNYHMIMMAPLYRVK